MSEQTISIASLTLTTISLIVTIIGWTRTYKNQQLLLERQLQAERKKKNSEVVFSQRLEQLNEIKKWFENGEHLWRFHRNQKQKPPDVKKYFIEWKSKLGAIKTSASIIDTHFRPPVNDPEFSGCLGKLSELAILITRLVAYSTEGQSAVKELDESIFGKPQSPINKLIDRFAELIESYLSNDFDYDNDNEIIEIYENAISYIDDISTNRLLMKDI